MVSDYVCEKSWTLTLVESQRMAMKFTEGQSVCIGMMIFHILTTRV